MGTAQDRIMEHARDLGEFTTTDMVRRIYGEQYTVYAHQNTYTKLAKLATWGDLTKVGRRKVRGQYQIVWRVA